MEPYDGTTSLNTALAKLHGKTKDYGNTPFSNITRPYKDDLGLGGSDPIIKPEHRLYIYNKECELLKGVETTANVPESTPYADETAPTPSETNSIELRSSKKGKTVGAVVKRADKIAAKSQRTQTAAFIITPVPNTQVRIYLEPEFVSALEFFAPDKASQREFLKGVALAGNSANPSSNARCAIVTELLTRVQSC